MVSVKVAVRVVVSWTVIPKQERNSLKLTVDIPQLPTVMILFLALASNCLKTSSVLEYESSNELTILSAWNLDLERIGASVGSILQNVIQFSIDKNR